MRIKDKKRFTLVCTCFILLVAGIIVLIVLGSAHKAKEGNVKKELNTFGTKNQSYQSVPISNNGSITLMENNYFKKYIIDCTKDLNTVTYYNSKDMLYVFLDNGEVSKLSLNQKKQEKDIYSQKIKNQDVVIFKTSHEKNNKVYIEQKDKRKIDILISKVSEPYAYTLVIDAGHGGTDPGTIEGGLYEKNITLLIAKYMQEYLNYEGVQTIYTREKDELLIKGTTSASIKKDLLARTDVANKINADAFVSVHVNNNVVSSCKGVTTYYYTAKENQEKERKELAEDIQKNVLIDDKWKDMKVKTNNYSVLVHTNMPSALVECGFLTNSEDREKLSKDQVLINSAKNISNGILQFFNSDTFKNYKKSKSVIK
ncbi:MAG: N-acetylmuramoyl-L-alanine amidase [Bacillota bacterium]|nr:N-acetylmuramoyl-L-alanine amidase [Bacillota bacterium]